MNTISPTLHRFAVRGSRFAVRGSQERRWLMAGRKIKRAMPWLRVPPCQTRVRVAAEHAPVVREPVPLGISQVVLSSEQVPVVLSQVLRVPGKVPSAFSPVPGCPSRVPVMAEPVPVSVSQVPASESPVPVLAGKFRHRFHRFRCCRGAGSRGGGIPASSTGQEWPEYKTANRISADGRHGSSRNPLSRRRAEARHYFEL